MPRFHLHVFARDELIADREGGEYDDLAMAIHEAHVSAREIWAAGIRMGEDRRDWTIRVADGDGAVLAEIAFVDTARGG
jgi:hypothetical protein